MRFSLTLAFVILLLSIIFCLSLTYVVLSTSFSLTLEIFLPLQVLILIWEICKYWWNSCYGWKRTRKVHISHIFDHFTFIIVISHLYFCNTFCMYLLRLWGYRLVYNFFCESFGLMGFQLVIASFYFQLWVTYSLFIAFV